LVAFLLFDGLAFWECAIVAAVLAPTDAALGQAVVSNTDLPEQVREGLEVESGLNDGGTVPLLTLFIALAAVEEGVEGGWLQFAVEQIGLGVLVGAAVGAAGGWVLRWASERGYTEPLFEKLALAALAIIIYVVAGEVGGNGFIAAFVGGAAAGVTAGAVSQKGRDFAEEEGELLNLTIFFIFGLYASTALADVTWTIAAYAVLSLTVIRMIPVAIALIGVGLGPATVAFVGWFGPRGLASIILGLVVVDDAGGLAGLSQIFVIMVATVLLSVVAHGVTAAPLSRRLAAAETPAADRPAQA
jgi:sodium/hydrogen antiporter